MYTHRQKKEFDNRSRFRSRKQDKILKLISKHKLANDEKQDDHQSMHKYVSWRSDVSTIKKKKNTDTEKIKVYEHR